MEVVFLIILFVLGACLGSFLCCQARRLHLKATKQGNRRLQATIYFLAIQMVQVSSKGTPRNPVVRAYYEKRKAEGKTSQQALICISRRLISVIYGMLKNGTEYRMLVVENAGENR